MNFLPSKPVSVGLQNKRQCLNNIYLILDESVNDDEDLGDTTVQIDSKGHKKQKLDTSVIGQKPHIAPATTSEISSESGQGIAADEISAVMQQALSDSSSSWSDEEGICNSLTSKSGPVGSSFESASAGKSTLVYVSFCR